MHSSGLIDCLLGLAKGIVAETIILVGSSIGRVDLRCFDDEKVLAASTRGPGCRGRWKGARGGRGALFWGFVAVGVGVTPTGVVRVGVLDRVRYHVFASVNHRKSGGRGE